MSIAIAVIILILLYVIAYSTGILYGRKQENFDGSPVPLDVQQQILNQKQSRCSLKCASNNPPNPNCCSQAINRKNINYMPYEKPIGYTNLFSTSISEMELPI